MATDIGSGMGSVYVVSDRFGGQTFAAVVGSMGQFTCEVPLAPGENRLTVHAVDKAGNEGTASVLITLDAQSPVVTLSAPATATAGKVWLA